MPQAVWTGFLGFGLVNVPVALYGATEERAVRFNQLVRGTSHRVRYRKVDEVTGDELSSDQIVRGFAIGGGSYVVVEDEELHEVAPGRSQEIAISDFVDLAEIDPTYFQKSYHLAPRTAQAAKPYALLREAMRRANRAGIATLVMRDKEYLVAVRPTEEVLALETLHFADEVRSPAAVLPAGLADQDLARRELDMAEQLVASLQASWDPHRYRDTYRDRVMALIEAKREGSTYVAEEPAPRENVVDLMAALEASVTKARVSRGEQAQPGHGRGAPAPPPATPGEQQTFEGMSRAELLALAADREVPGRAKMTKLQLVKALQEAGAGAGEGTPRRRSAS